MSNCSRNLAVGHYICNHQQQMFRDKVQSVVLLDFGATSFFMDIKYAHGNTISTIKKYVPIYGCLVSSSVITQYIISLDLPLGKH